MAQVARTAQIARLALLAVAVIGGLTGCGGRYARGSSSPRAPNRGITAAALPYRILDGRTGRQLDEAAFWPALAKARAVCVGEDHPNPHHHWWQLEVVKQLGQRAASGSMLGLGMEMFQRPFQGVLDDYQAKRIDAAALRSRTGWEDRWGYDYAFYGPIIDAAVAVGGRLIALNAPKELTKKVVRKGLSSLTPDEKAQVPELKLDDATHRAWFDALMERMGGAHGHGSKPEEAADKPTGDKPTGDKPTGDKPTGDKPTGDTAPAMPSAEQVYTVQVMWDETMADTAAKWLRANPTGRMVILAGNGHCHDSAIVNRIKRRGLADVVSVRPVIDDGEGSVAEVLAKPMNDYVVVLEMPN
ncbi:MAG: ChaN family lipoprotein [Kofleriaceae bacterium]